MLFSFAACRSMDGYTPLLGAADGGLVSGGCVQLA
jgi:hypothetical protein